MLPATSTDDSWCHCSSVSIEISHSRPGAEAVQFGGEDCVKC